MNQTAKRTSALKKAILIILILSAAQLVYVYFGQSLLTSVKRPDKADYVKVAEDLLDGGGLYEFQYPFAYSFFVGLAAFFPERLQNNLFYAMQVVWKAGFLLAIFCALRKKLKEEESLIAILLVGLSPLWFMYSFRYMAENLEVPLVILTMLLHFNMREVLSGNASAGKKLLYTFIAALLAWLCFMTKYLCLLLLPVFCLLWGSGALIARAVGPAGPSKGGAPGTKPFCFEPDNHSSRLSGGRIARAAVWSVIYTGIVLALIVLYAAIIAKGQGRPLKLDVIKLTMGFSQASGPDKVGYVFLPDGKWVLCYTLYGLLGASVFAASLIGRASWEKTRKYLAEVLGILAAAAVLIYAASRHSTLAWYNTDGYMLKLLGRYVSLMTTMGLLLIFYMIPEDGRLRDGPGSSAKLSNAGFGEVVKNPGLSAGAIVRTLIGAAAGYLIVVLAWKILYRNALGLNMDPNFLAENRGLDLLAFWRIGKGAAVFYMLMILLNAVVRKRKVLYLTLVLYFLLNDLSLFVWI